MSQPKKSPLQIAAEILTENRERILVVTPAGCFEFEECRVIDNEMTIRCAFYGKDAKAKEQLTRAAIRFAEEFLEAQKKLSSTGTLAYPKETK